MSRFVDPEAVAELVKASGVLESYKDCTAASLAYYRQSLADLMSSRHFIVIPLAYRAEGVIRFSAGKAEFVEGGVVQMTLHLRRTDAPVKECEVEAACFLISNEARNSISIQACNRGYGFFVVGFLNPADDK